MLGELQQEQVAPSSADPESCSVLHHQGLHRGPGGGNLGGRLHSAARITPTGEENLLQSVCFSGRTLGDGGMYLMI